MPQTRMIENCKDREAFGLTMGEYEQIYEVALNMVDQGKKHESTIVESTGRVIMAALECMENIPAFLEQYQKYENAAYGE